jgi:hypothetical protein
LETWCEHRQDPNDARATEEEIFLAIEIIAKLRKPAKAVVLEHGCTWRYRSILQEYAGYIGTVQRRGIYGYEVTRVQQV